MSLFEGHVVRLDGEESSFDVLSPNHHVDEKGGLGGIHLEPLGLTEGIKSTKGSNSGVTEGVSHGVNNFLHVVFDLAHQFEVGGEFDVLNTDVGVHTDGNGTLFIGVLKFEVLDSLEDLGHESHNLNGLVTVRENVEQVGGGGEVESGEALTLLSHVLVKSLLTNLELVEHVIETLENPVLITEDKSELFLVGILKNALDLLIDEDELLGLFGKFFLHLIGAQEQVLKVRPVTLYLGGHRQDLGDVRERLGPSLDLGLESCDVAGGLHGGSLVSVFLEQVEVLLSQSDQEDVGLLVLVEIEFDVLPGQFKFSESLLHLGLLLGLIGDFFNVVLEVLEVQVVD